MPGWFRRVSLYVAPMRHEGFGLTPLEAMASATAVVATSTGAAPMLVEDGETGVLIPPNDLEALVAAIESSWPSLGLPSGWAERDARRRWRATTSIARRRASTRSTASAGPAADNGTRPFAKARPIEFPCAEIPSRPQTAYGYAVKICE